MIISVYQLKYFIKERKNNVKTQIANIIVTLRSSVIPEVVDHFSVQNRGQQPFRRK